MTDYIIEPPDQTPGPGTSAASATGAPPSSASSSAGGSKYLIDPPPPDAFAGQSALEGGIEHGIGNVGWGAAQLAAHTLAPKSVSDWVDRHIQERNAAYKASPTIAQHRIQAGVGNVIGDIGGATVATLPLAALAPTTLAGAAGVGALTGAVSALPQEVEHPDHYWAQKTGQVVESGLQGAILGPLFHGVAGAVRWFRGRGDPEQQAGQIISDAVSEKTRGGGPTAQEVIADRDAAQAAGQPYALLDVTPELGGSVYRGQGGGRTTIKNFQEGRIGKFENQDALDQVLQRTAQGKRLATRIASDLGTGEMGETAKSLAVRRSENARAPWAKAMTTKPVWSPRLNQFLNDPTGEVQQGLRLGWKIEQSEALAEGRRANPTDFAITDFNEAGDPIIGKVPNMKTLQMAKQGLDDMITRMRNSPELNRMGVFTPTKEYRALVKKRTAFVKTLDDLNSDYKAAREQWSGDTESMEALQDGKDMLSRSTSLEDFANRWNELTPNDREFFKLGVANELKQDLDHVRGQGDLSKAIVNTADARQKLHMMFPDNAGYEDFMGFITRERKMFETGTQVMKGSQTAERLEQDRQNAQRFRTIRSLGHVAAHPHSPFAWYEMTRRLQEARGRAAEPALNEALARQLTNPNIPLGVTPKGGLQVGTPPPPRPQVAPWAAYAGGIAPYIFGGY